MTTFLINKYSWLMYFIIPLIATLVIFHPILQVAQRRTLVDSPNERKLHKAPVPVLGGVAVFFGIVVGILFLDTSLVGTALCPVISAMAVMLYIGFIDDILNINSTIRFILEILVALVMICGAGLYICDFQGLWGINIVSVTTGVLLSVITFVGIVNAINMIDGVDGLSSAFCILVIGCFGIVFHICSNHAFTALALMEIGALLPFFCHNVFGSSTKMFIGDSGTMMVGASIAAMVMAILSGECQLYQVHPELDFSLIAFCVAVLSIPVADTLRVMFCRIAHRRMPFSPDKTHLHHLLIDIGFSYISVTCMEILLNLAVIAVLFLSWRAGASVEMQLYATVGAASLADFGLAALLIAASRKRNRTYIIIQKIASHTHWESMRFWQIIRNMVDHKYAKN